MGATGRPAGVYVALLRGINVGGKNIIKMADLRACFEDHGFRDVVTYIQSGNVIFRPMVVTRADLAAKIEKMLTDEFAYEASVALRSHQQMRSVVADAPEGFGSQPKTYKYDAIFLKPPLTATQAMKHLSAKPGVDEAHSGKRVLYFSRLTSKASSSRLTRLVSLPLYKSMTIRNWNTTTKLVEMMGSIGAP